MGRNPSHFSEEQLRDTAQLIANGISQANTAAYLGLGSTRGVQTRLHAMRRVLMETTQDLRWNNANAVALCRGYLGEPVDPRALGSRG